MGKRVPEVLAKARRAGTPPTRPTNRPRASTGLYGFQPYDAFNAKRPPTKAELIRSYRQAVFVCANLRAAAMASLPVRLYGTTKRGQKSISYWPTKSISRERMEWLHKSPCGAVSKRLASADHVEEITLHPVLDLLDTVNPWMDKFQLFELDQLYLDIVGQAFWAFTPGPLGTPVEIMPLPAWLVTPTPDFSGTDVIRDFVYSGGNGPTYFAQEELVFYKTNNLFDPYIQGYSPLQAGYEHAQVHDKHTEFEDSILTNRARPDAMLIPTEEGAPIAWEETQRINVEFRQSLAQAQAGGLWIAPGGLKLAPLTWAPRDMGELASAKDALYAVARTFGVPIPLVDGNAANRANMDAALLIFSRFTLRPCVRRKEECLNSNFLPRFEDSDRMFLAFDDPVPADAAAERERHKTYFGLGVYSPNAIAAEIGEAPFEGGDVRFIPTGFVPLDRAANPPEPQIIASLPVPAPDEEPDDTRTPAASDEDDEEKPDDEPHKEGDDVTADDAAKEKSWLGDGEREDGGDPFAWPQRLELRVRSA